MQAGLLRRSSRLAQPKRSEQTKTPAVEKTAKAKAAKAKAAKPKPKKWRRKEKGGGTPTDKALHIDPQHRDRTWQAATDYLKDPFFKKIMTTVDDFDRYNLSADGALWQNVEVYGDRLCITAGTVDGRLGEAREHVLEHVHEMTVHTGSRKMLAQALNHCWWPTLSSDIEKYCETCEACQASKTGTRMRNSKLHSMPIPAGPPQMIAADFQSPLVKAERRGKEVDFLCNWIDTFSGEVISVPWEQTITAKGCAELGFQFVVGNTYSDRISPRPSMDVRFEGLGTKLLLSTSFHPQTSERIERMHRDLNAMLRQIVSRRTDELA